MHKLIGGIAFAVLSILLATGVSSAQGDNGTLEIRVTGPGGESLGGTVCAQFGPVDEGLFPHGGAGDNTISSHTVPAGEYVVSVGTHCPRRSDILPISAGGVTLAGADLDLATFVVEPGKTTVATVITGRGLIRGSFSRAGSSHDTCRVEAHGSVAGGSTPNALIASMEVDGSSYELPVPPGSYRISAICTQASEPHYWPNNSRFVSDAQTLTIAHGQTRSGINLSAAASDGTSSYVAFSVSELSQSVVYCTDAVSVNDSGRVIRADRIAAGTLFQGHSVPRLPLGSYKLRFWDCSGSGFADVWYPNVASQAEAEIIVLSEPGEVRLDLIHVVPDPALICGGLPATIIGTDGDDVIIGTDGVDVIVGLEGNDIIRGLEGNDKICGGPGRDKLFGGHGRDEIYGGTRNDIVKGDGGIDKLYGGSGNDRITGGGGSDTLVGGAGARDRLIGRNGIDTCTDKQADTFYLECEAGTG